MKHHKKFSFGLILFLVLPILIIISTSTNPVPESTLFVFMTEQDEYLNGTLYLQDLSLPILDGEILVNNSYLYYMDVSENKLKVKSNVSAEFEKNDISLTFDLGLENNDSKSSVLNVRIDSKEFEIETFNNYRFASSTITYRYDTECTWVQLNRIEDAIDILERETILNFKETSREPNLYIQCYDYTVQTDEGIRLGEGSPRFYEEISRTIINSSINIYARKDAVYCLNYPVTEIHEILHALNFHHLNDSSSVIHPGIGGEVCPELDKDIINCIEDIYSNRKGCRGIEFILT